VIDTPTDRVSVGTRVLCVDDNPDIADSEAMLLTQVGYDARSCYGGRDALVLAEVFCPSIFLIDINMPGMEGDALAAKLRERTEDRPLSLIAVTASSADVFGEWTALFDMFLFKPVFTEKLLAAIASSMRQKLAVILDSNPSPGLQSVDQALLKIYP
jgi:DNA-binding response OmpR family regulator